MPSAPYRSARTPSKSVEVKGIEPAWRTTVESRPVIVGRPFSLIDNAQPRAVCVINEKTRDTLGLDADPTGQAILIDDRRFIVVGVVAAQRRVVDV